MMGVMLYWLGMYDKAITYYKALVYANKTFLKSTLAGKVFPGLSTGLCSGMESWTEGKRISG